MACTLLKIQRHDDPTDTGETGVAAASHSVYVNGEKVLVYTGAGNDYVSPSGEEILGDLVSTCGTQGVYVNGWPMAVEGSLLEGPTSNYMAGPDPDHSVYASSESS